MTKTIFYTERNGLRVGDRVFLNAKGHRVYPYSKRHTGIVVGFCRGTELYVKFDALKNKIIIDERLLEK